MRATSVRGGPAYRLVRRGADVAPAFVDDPVQRHAGVDPERVLVLTFGRPGAQALRDRIEARIADTPGASCNSRRYTFHAYAVGLLRRAAAERGEPAPGCSPVLSRT